MAKKPDPVDPVEEFIEASVRHLAAHDCTGPIHDPDTHGITFVRGDNGAFHQYDKELTLPNFAHLKHGPTAVEHKERIKVIEDSLHNQHFGAITEFVNWVDPGVPPIAGGSRQYFIEMLAPVVTADQSAVTGTSEAAVCSVSPFTATVANQLQPGQRYEIKIAGVMTTAGASPGTLTITPRWGTTSGGTTLGASAASATLATSQTAVPWRIEAEFTCRGPSTSSATGVMNGDFFCSAALSGPLSFGGTTATIDSTSAQGFYFGVTLGSASDSMTVKQIAVLACN